MDRCHALIPPPPPSPSSRTAVRSMWAAAVGGVLAVAALAVVGVWASPFLGGEKRPATPDAKTYGEWIMSVCGGPQFKDTLFTWGFLKQAAQRLWKRKVLYAGKRTAAVGSRVPDVDLVTLEGAPVRLSSFAPTRPGVPWVLNFGSYS
jgi:hypothetical protein